MQKQKQKIVVGGKTYIPMKCKRCSHQWMYRGNSEYRTSCPQCLTNVLLPRDE